MYTFDVEQLKQSLENSKKQCDKIDRIIRPFITTKLNEKQSTELCQIGKFLSIIGNSTIIERLESPDFIILHKNERIGLEHEQIFNSRKVEKIKSIEKLFSTSSHFFEQQHPDIKVLVNCFLTTDNFQFKKRDVDILVRQICDYIYAEITNDINIKKPHFIQEIVIMKHSRVDFVYNPGPSYVEYLTPDILTKAIEKKEVLIESYKENSKIKKQWLLIVIGSNPSCTYEYEDYPFTAEIKSNFEQIYLMEDINSNVWKIK